MFVCDECGAEFEKDYDGCPKCGSSDYKRVCAACGDINADDGMCDECVDKYAFDYDTLIKASDKCTNDKVQVPALAAEVLNNEQIRLALFSYIRQHKIDCRAFIESDRGWFADFLEKEE